MAVGDDPGEPVSVPVDHQERIQTKQAELQAAHSSLNNWIDDVPDAPVFTPTAAEFTDPMAYIAKIQSEAAEWGICKIIPPVSAAVPGSTVLLQKGPYRFTTRMQQLRRSEPSALDKNDPYWNGKEYSIVSYERAANEFAYKRYNMASGLPARFVEAEYWREWNGTGPPVRVEYGNDVEGTAFSEQPWDPLSASPWACTSLPKAKHSSLRLLPIEIPGITTPMMYIGMLFSTFAWHVEDLYLYSINFHHFGAPKTWYGVPASAADSFERVAALVSTKLAGTEEPTLVARKTAEKLMGKTVMFSPGVLGPAGVRVCRVVQQPGEFVVTFPRAYHAGFSHGFNCGEAVNFGTPDWLPCGLAANIRYGLMRHVPLLSVEALLCLEAHELAQSIQDPASLCAVKRRWQRITKNTFVALMIWQNKVRHRLMSAGATCCVISNGATPLLRCDTCQQLCYLAAAVPTPHSGDRHRGTRCLRCAASDLEPWGSSPMDGWSVICHPDLSDQEGMAKFWQCEAVREQDGQTADLEDACRSRLTNEPSWRSISSEAADTRYKKYEWKDIPLTTADLTSAEWSWCAQLVPMAAKTSSSNQQANVSKPKSRGKRTSASQKASRRQKQNRPLSWSSTLKMGPNSTAADISADLRPSDWRHSEQLTGTSIHGRTAPQGVSKEPCAALPVGTPDARDCFPPVECSPAPPGRCQQSPCQNPCSATRPSYSITLKVGSKVLTSNVVRNHSPELCSESCALR